jgi:cardiolipin synthase
VSTTPGTARPPADNAAWACQIAERLPAADVRHLAEAAATGAFSVRSLRAQAGSPELRGACDQLLARLAAGNPDQLAGLLAGAAEAVKRARRHQRLDVVWTGPETKSGTGRLTAATIVELLGKARREILIVSYATYTEPTIAAALEAATGRGVEVTILAERHEDNPNYSGVSMPFPGLHAVRLRWPGHRRPAAGSAMHAKIIVIDDRIALVGSANLTSRAMESNLECGILITGGREPRAIRDHIMDLKWLGVLEQS